MPPDHFTATEVRVAATCPRMFHFDRRAAAGRDADRVDSSRIWKAGRSAATACGPLFHATIDRFNRRAAADPAVPALFAAGHPRDDIHRLLRTYVNDHCLDYPAFLPRPPDQKTNFIAAIDRYVAELADIVADARARGVDPAELAASLFADRRRRLDVRFPLPSGESVRVVGELDYVFHDWRTGRRRILDYKLAPADAPSNDLFQVALYALMHHQQHGTRPDAGLLYLHPEREVVERTWPQIEADRPKVLALLQSMLAWSRFDPDEPAQATKPPGEPAWCDHCRWDARDHCESTLGPKAQGSRILPGVAAPAEPPAAAPTPLKLRSRAENRQTRLFAAPASKPAPNPRPGQSSASPRTATSDPNPAVIAPGQSGLDVEAADPRPPIAPLASAQTQEGERPRAPGHPDDHLILGTTSGGHPAALPVAALKTHIAVVGAAGSGKTYAAKVLVEEAVGLGVPVLAIDPQGDLVQFLRPAPEPTGASAPQLANRRAYLDRVEPRIWSPGVAVARPFHFNPLRLPEPTDWQQLEEVDRINFLTLVATQLLDLTQIQGRQFNIHQTFLMSLLRRLIAAPGLEPPSIHDLLDAIRKPDRLGPRWKPDHYLPRSSQQNLARDLTTATDGAGQLLHTGGEPFDLDRLVSPDRAGRTPLNVIYLNALSGDKPKAQVVARIATEVYRWMIARGADPSGRPRLLVYLDEARDFAPAGTAKPPAKDPLIRLFAQGRKYGVCGLICTQSPRSVDYNVFANCSTKLVGRLESAQDLERVAEWFSAGRPAWLAGRVKAGPGDFVGRWPGQPQALEGTPFRTRPLHSLHEGAWSPDRVEREAR